MGYDSFEDFEDDLDASGDAPKWVKPVLIVVAILLLLGIVVGTSALFMQQRNSPMHATQEWFDAMWDIDSETVLDRTCDDQIWVSHAVSAGTSVGGIIKFLGIEALPGFTELLGEAVLDVDFEKLGDNFEIDRSRLEYEERVVDAETAVVTVTGQLRFQIFGGWYPYRMDEHWLVIREDDRWKWCGRQHGNLP